ncbi:hypothetical protein DL96DRAFT_1550823 [Flagelloscypha sp. PMI_526]|nr:hypothetical protein DL96DRAFT_1550823 [Flagelloscypha sp. PMI_526]
MPSKARKEKIPVKNSTLREPSDPSNDPRAAHLSDRARAMLPTLDALLAATRRPVHFLADDSKTLSTLNGRYDRTHPAMRDVLNFVFAEATRNSAGSRGKQFPVHYNSSPPSRDTQDDFWNTDAPNLMTPPTCVPNQSQSPGDNDLIQSSQYFERNSFFLESFNASPPSSNTALAKALPTCPQSKRQTFSNDLARSETLQLTQVPSNNISPALSDEPRSCSPSSKCYALAPSSHNADISSFLAKTTPVLETPRFVTPPQWAILPSPSRIADPQFESQEEEDIDELDNMSEKATVEKRFLPPEGDTPTHQIDLVNELRESVVPQIRINKPHSFMFDIEDIQAESSFVGESHSRVQTQDPAEWSPPARHHPSCPVPTQELDLGQDFNSQGVENMEVEAMDIVTRLVEGELEFEGLR